MNASTDDCAREPIHIPGGIQPHGVLLVLHGEDLRLLQSSANATAVLGMPAGNAATLADLPGGGALLRELKAWLQRDDAVLLAGIRLDAGPFQVTAHRTGQGVMLELEPSASAEEQTLELLYPRLRRFLDELGRIEDAQRLGEAAVRELRDLTGFHRVLLYRFDEDWNGTVVAEDGDGTLPSYLDLRFPASDIPAQARELYRRNRLRLIPDARYAPVPIEPARSPLDGQPLNLSDAALRSVSPVHLEYMRNMGTAASMSVSVLVAGALWGLLSCHHATPRIVGPQLRAACDVLGQIVALQIGARERHGLATRRLALKRIESEMLARLTRAPSFEVGLVDNPEAWLRMVDAAGAAVVRGDAVLTAGATPSIEDIRELAGWLRRRGGDPLYASASLAADFPPAAAYVDQACGVLAVSVSALHPDYILWFRPELIHTVRWGGEPAKAEGDTPGRLHPRKSFEQWTELVRGKALPWHEAERDAALDFRNAIVEFVLRRAEERAALTEKLESSNRELETFSYSVSHDLRAPFRHIVGFAQLLAAREKGLDEKSRHYLDAVVNAAMSAGRLVDDLLNFSQLGRSSLAPGRVDVQKMIGEIRQSREFDERGREIEWRVGALPPAWGDGALLRQAFTNLLDNALKYTRGRTPAVIEVSGEARGHESTYTVRDNGVGFDMAYAGKLFGVFQRLHLAEEFEGTGIGLALTRRIVDRHGGRIAAEGTLGKGATFSITLPNRPQEIE